MHENNIKILTLNVAMLPFPLGIGNRRKRAEGIVQEIKKMDIKPHVITFQECFSSTAKKIFKKQLSKMFPYYYFDTAPKKYYIGVNSGLAVFSQLPISNPVVHYFSLYRGEENFATKGVLGVQINGTNKKIFVFTTHIQTGGELCIFKPFNKTNQLPIDIKLHQMSEIKQFVDSYVSDPISGVFITGDFNIKSERPEYNTIKNIMNVHDPHDQFLSEDNGTSINSGYRIDYIFYDKIYPVKGYSKIIKNFDSHTDHRAVFANFE